MQAEMTVLENIIENSEMMATHLLICSIISVGWGLNYDFIWAWKSGKKPSANNDMISNTIPITWDYWVLYSAYGSK